MTDSQPRITIELAALLPLAFDAEVTGVPERDQLRYDVPSCHIPEVAASIRRQLAHVALTWRDSSDGMVAVNWTFHDTSRPVEKLQKHKKKRFPVIKSPRVTDLVGAERAREAWCFAAWLPYPVDLLCSPATSHDYIWIPTNVEELGDSTGADVRDAACHELKHWVQNRMRYQMGIQDFPRAHDTDYWERLRNVLSQDLMVHRFTAVIRDRVAKRNRRSGSQ